MIRHREFDASEMSLSSYLIYGSRADDLQASPVFSSRSFRHSCIFIHSQTGIQQPADLAGKGVGVPEYQMTAPLWQRAVLRHEYGVHPSSIHWLQGGLEQPGRQEKQAITLPSDSVVSRNEVATAERSVIATGVAKMAGILPR